MGSSASLNLENKIGNIEKNYCADLNIINLSSTKEIEQRKINQIIFGKQFSQH